MEWASPLVFALVVLVVVIPLALLLAAVALLGFVGHFHAGRLISRASFECPFSRRRVNVEFLTAPDSERTAADVLSCSLFSEPRHVTCAKRCLDLASAGWSPPLTMPRYALLADGVALRPVGAGHGQESKN